MPSTSPHGVATVEGAQVTPSPVTIAQLAEHSSLELTALGGQGGMARAVAVPRIQKPGLALTGWPEQLHPRRVLVLGGEPINEPVLFHGPFVMNTREEIIAAYEDFRRGKFGHLE